MKIPAKQKECIKVVRSMRKAVAACSVRARNRMLAMEEKHGALSDEYMAARCGYEEATEQLKMIDYRLRVRQAELEQPFRKGF